MARKFSSLGFPSGRNNLGEDREIPEVLSLSFTDDFVDLSATSISLPTCINVVVEHGRKLCFLVDVNKITVMKYSATHQPSNDFGFLVW